MGRMWLFGGLALVAGCASDKGGADAADDGPACMGAKCDDLESSTEDSGDSGDADTGDTSPGTLQEICEERRADALSEGREAFARDALRWSCADVPGTMPAERGQEYCEYFALVQLPGSSTSKVLGMLLGADFDAGHTAVGLDLSQADIAALEGDPDAIVGQCVFTSWNADETVPAVDQGEVPKILDRTVDDPEVFRMKLDANTREAAVQLVADCMEFIAPEGDPDDPGDPLHDPFLRACELNAEINATETRKSDNVACTASVRMAECGCAVQDGTTTLADALSPVDRLGFPLGGWQGRDALPSGCRWVDVAAGSHTIVSCDLTALAVLDHADELKAHCQSRYAGDVVVYVPVPSSSITCEPSADETYGSTCGELPWVVTP